ncbi:MAG: DUF6596 domain-containing protein [Cyanobacteria bacterium J06598_1]
MMDASSAAALAARNAYGRLLAYLAVRTRDVSAAEDALGDAFLQALTTWPNRGVPTNPEAWLLVIARRRLIDGARRTQTQAKALKLLDLDGFESASTAELMTFPDERLKLLFVCAHPAIDAKLHTPLMLQTILGLNAAQIGSAFLVPPTTMGQRLVRVKAKIRDAGIPFELPSGVNLAERSHAVLQAIYAAYNADWTAANGSDCKQLGLSQEAMWLAELCAQLMPDEPEAYGLLALIRYCESRRSARKTPEGRYVPLLEQDTTLWSRKLISEAELALKQAASYQCLGGFQLEAAIQSIHAQRLHTGHVDWKQLSQLYAGLIQIAPTVGAHVGYVAVIAHTQSAAKALVQLNSIQDKGLQTYQPYWAVKADLLKQVGEIEKAKQAYSQAIGLSEDPAVRAFLSEKSLELVNQR